MNISLNWLKNYINISDEPETIAADLTSLGLEVGTITEFSSVKGGLKGLVVGEVLTCEKHPNADKLSLTTVDIGSGEIQKIVCGAPNVAAGQKVIVATVGTTLYSGDEAFTIKKAKIRGEESNGMICAEDEVGIGSSHAGIMVLPSDTPVGLPASEYFNIEEDVVFEIDLTPNRIDAASHIGVARDLAAFRNIKYNIPDVSKFKVSKNTYSIDLEVANPEACPRYSGICMDNVKVTDSPQWLQNRLKAIGLNPINNIVDVTNFVMFETGQPLHAFDGDKIANNKIVVRTVDENHKFVTLDGVERSLKSKDLMICNAVEPMCIAGVFGGLDSGISKNTKKLFIESAYFNPGWVRKTAKTHGLSTDSSFRYERGADVNITLYAAKRAAMLIEQIGAGEISSELKDVYPNKIENNIVDFSYETCCKLIGKEISKSEIDKILTALEIKVLESKGDNLKLEIPSYRVDVTREADVIEEVLRIYGYNNIENPEKVSFSVLNSEKLSLDKLQNTISDLLVSDGFNEIKCNSLISAKYFNQDDKSIVRICNPLSADLAIMRPTPIIGGLETIVFNVHHKISDLKLFEFGRTYHANTEIAELSKIERYYESKFLALWITGNKDVLSWNQKEKPSDFFTLKSYVIKITTRLGIDLVELNEDFVSDSNFEYALQYKYKEIVFCSFGKLNAKLAKSTDCDKDVFYAEINWDLVKELVAKNKISYKSISRFPTVKRDLALVIDKNISYKQMVDLAKKTEPNYISEVNLFDVYEGKNIEQGKISYALSFSLDDHEKTMTDRQINKIMERLIKAFETELNAILR